MKTLLAAALCWTLFEATLSRLDRPSYVPCVTSSECFKEQCCTIREGRFTVPTCRPWASEGESCWGGPVDRNLTYLDGTRVELRGVYVGKCGCAPGLFCDRGQCVPAKLAFDLFNHIDYDNDNYDNIRDLD